MSFELLLHPLPGDVIFTTGNKGIKAAQRVTLQKHSKYTHVAIMTGTRQVCEAMIGTQVKTHDFPKWSEDRYQKNKRETRVVLRKVGLDLGRHIVKFSRSVGLHLDEEYCPSVLWNSEAPEGISICSSVVLNILRDAGIELENVEALKRAPTPAKLFKILNQNGFEKIDYGNFERTAYKAYPVFDALKDHELSLMLDRVSAEKATLVEKLWGWSFTAVRDLNKNPVPLMLNYIHPMRRSAFEVYADGTRFAHRFAFDLIELENRGRLNWKPEFQTEWERQTKSFRQGFGEHLNFSEAFLKLAADGILGNLGEEITDFWIKLIEGDFGYHGPAATVFFDYFLFTVIVGDTPAGINGREDFSLHVPPEITELPAEFFPSKRRELLELMFRVIEVAIKERAIALTFESRFYGFDKTRLRSELLRFRKDVSLRWGHNLREDDENAAKLHNNLIGYQHFLREVTPSIVGRVEFPTRDHNEME